MKQEDRIKTDKHMRPVVHTQQLFTFEMDVHGRTSRVHVMHKDKRVAESEKSTVRIRKKNAAAE